MCAGRRNENQLQILKQGICMKAICSSSVMQRSFLYREQQGSSWWVSKVLQMQVGHTRDGGGHTGPFSLYDMGPIWPREPLDRFKK